MNVPAYSIGAKNNWGGYFFRGICLCLADWSTYCNLNLAEVLKPGLAIVVCQKKVLMSISCLLLLLLLLSLKQTHNFFFAQCVSYPAKKLDYKIEIVLFSDLFRICLFINEVIQKKVTKCASNKCISDVCLQLKRNNTNKAKMHLLSWHTEIAVVLLTKQQIELRAKS